MPVSIIQTQDNPEFIDIEQVLQKAKAAGEKQALTGYKCQTRNVLLKKFSEQEVDAYIQGYNECIKNPNMLLILQRKALNRCSKAGREYAQNGCHGGRRPLPEDLQKKNGYNDAQVAAYLEGFDSVKITEEERALRIARRTAIYSASRGYSRATPEALKEKNDFTDAQIAAYYERYDELAATPEEQELQRVKAASYKQAISIGKCPSRGDLLKSYSENATDVYLQTFDEVLKNPGILKTSEQIAILKAKKSGEKFARIGGQRPLLDYLKQKNNYTKNQAEAYLKAFDRVKMTSEELALSNAKVVDSLKANEERMALPHNDFQNLDNNVVPQGELYHFLPSFSAFCNVASKPLLPSFKSLLVEVANKSNQRIIFNR